MANLVLITQALAHSNYTVEHIRYLVRTNKVQGKKVGGVWLVDLDDLMRYEQEMEDLGPQRYTPHDKRDDP